MNRFVASAIVSTALIAAAAQARPRVSETERNRAIMTAFAGQFHGRRDVTEVFAKFVVPGHIRHNPGQSDGRDAAVAGPPPKFATSGARFGVKRIIVDGDLAVNAHPMF